jgi:hypothetical protein
MLSVSLKKTLLLWTATASAKITGPAEQNTSGTGSLII